MITFNIDVELPTLNEYITKERSNRFAAAALKKKYTLICGLAAKNIKKRIKRNTRYSLILNWITKNNKKDPDNVYFGVKFILDGLVNAGVLQNDTRRFIKNIHHNITTGKKFNIEVNLIPEDND